MTGALDDIKHFMEKISNGNLDPLDLEAYRRASQELVEIYYLVTDGTTPVVKIEQAIITILHGGK